MTINKRLTNENSLCFLVVAVLYCMAVCLNVYWISKDISPPSFDEALHLINAERQYNYLSQGQVISALRVSNWYYPPFVYQWTALIRILTDNSLYAPFLTLQLFQFILIFSLYSIGAKIKSPFLGLLCATGGALSPFAVNMSHEYLLDYPSASMTALSFALLLKSDSFGKKIPTFLFFVTLALGALVKWTTPVFLILPSSIVFARMLENALVEKRKNVIIFFVMLTLLTIISVWLGINILQGGLAREVRSDSEYLILLAKSVLPVVILAGLLLIFRNIPMQIRLLFIGICLLVIIVWYYYAPALSHLAGSLTTGAAGGVGEGDPLDVFSYLYLYVFKFQGVFFSIFLLIGLFVYFLRKNNNKLLDLCFSGFLFGLCLLYLIPNRDVRYFMPLLVFSAPLMTFWIPDIKNRLSNIIILSCFGFVVLFGWTSWLFTGNIPQATLAPYEYAVFHPGPASDDWRFQEILDNVERLSTGKKAMIILSEVRAQKTTPFTINSLSWYHMQKRGETYQVLPGECETFLQDKFCVSYFFSNTILKKGEKYNAIIELFIYDRNSRPDIPGPIEKIYQQKGITGNREMIEEYEIPDNLNVRLSTYKPDI